MRRKILAGLFLLSYPFAVRAALIFGQVTIASTMLFLVSTVLVITSFGGPIKRRRAPLLVFSALAIFSLSGIASNTQYALYLPPVIINLAMLAVFGGTLLPGREPLITTFHRMTISCDIDPVIITYTHRLTYIWAFLFAAMAVESTLLAVFAPLTVWSLFTNFLNYFFVIVLLVGEYFYRIVRYQHLPHPSLLQFLRNLVKSDLVHSAIPNSRR